MINTFFNIVLWISFILWILIAIFILLCKKLAKKRGNYNYHKLELRDKKGPEGKAVGYAVISRDENNRAFMIIKDQDGNELMTVRKIKIISKPNNILN